VNTVFIPTKSSNGENSFLNRNSIFLQTRGIKKTKTPKSLSLSATVKSASSKRIWNGLIKIAKAALKEKTREVGLGNKMIPYLHPASSWICIPSFDHGLVQPLCSFLEAIHNTGKRVLHRSIKAPACRLKA